MYSNICQISGKKFPRVWIDKQTSALFIVRPSFSSYEKHITGEPLQQNYILFAKNSFIGIPRNYEKFFIDLGEFL